jgi:Uma2 family endonuclease
MTAPAAPKTFEIEDPNGLSLAAYPDTSLLVTHDDQPLDNMYVERQQKLLSQVLAEGWAAPEGKKFLVFQNVGLFHKYSAPPVVPDFMMTLSVPSPMKFHEDPNSRSYFVWVYGAPPDLVIEIVSDLRGGEFGHKKDHYAHIGVPYYVVYDPSLHYRGELLTSYALTVGKTYQELDDHWLPTLKLGFCFWEGEYQGTEAQWLRCRDEHGDLLLLASERLVPMQERLTIEAGLVKQLSGRLEAERSRTEVEKQRAEVEKQRAEAEKQRAEAEKQRAEAEKQRADDLAVELERLRAFLKTGG